MSRHYFHTIGKKANEGTAVPPALLERFESGVDMRRMLTWASSCDGLQILDRCDQPYLVRPVSALCARSVIYYGDLAFHSHARRPLPLGEVCSTL